MSIQAWNNEYRRWHYLPSSRSTRPARALRWFIKHGLSRIPKPGLVLDAGCGTGRSAIYLATHGWRTLGLDYSPVAIKIARASAKRSAATSRASFAVHDITKSLPLADLSCDLILDMSCLHLLTKIGRQAYAREVNRVLKPGGYFLIFAIANCPATNRWRLAHPGPEPRSYIVPQNGNFEKAFVKSELFKLFKPLQMQSCKNIPVSIRAYGDTIHINNLRVLFRKRLPNHVDKKRGKGGRK